MVDRLKNALDLFLFLVAFYVLWTLRATVFYSIDESIASPIARAAYSDLLKFALWVVPAAAFAFVVRRASPVKYLGLSAWPNRRSWSQCIGVTIAFLFIVVLFESVAGEKSISSSGLSALPIAQWLLQLVLSPLLEEILFRGLILKELLAILPAYLAIVLTSVLFVGIHLPYWLSHGGATDAIVANAAGVFIFSILACLLFAKTASVWPPTVAHIANNLLSSLLIAANASHVP